MTNIPRKLSVEEMQNDAALWEIGQNVVITIDGKQSNGVLEYNLDEGWLRQYKKKDGEFVVKNGELVVERVTSDNIEVKMKDGICHI